MLVDHLSHPDMDDVFRPRSTFLRKNYLEVSQRGAAQIRYPYAYVAPSTRASRPGSTVFAHRKLSIVDSAASSASLTSRSASSLCSRRTAV